MKKLFKLLLILGLAILVLAMIGVVIFKSKINESAGNDWTQKTIVIETGESSASITKKLADNGIIKDTKLFDIYLRTSGKAQAIKAGNHTLGANMTMPEILDNLSKSEISEVWITIPEGWRIDQIAAYLENKKLVRARDFAKQAIVDDYKADYDFLQYLPTGTTLEGYLFPDTYKVAAEPTADSVIRKMLDNFGEKFDQKYRDDATSQNWPIQKLITFASIVEKESGRDADREIIAGIFKNRLDQDMPLQSDATVTYITGRPDTRPTIEETKTESPYNTYLHTGLPPGPVGNPGIKAVQDALYPTKTPYLYFISDADGVAHFASTYEEHQANIERYLE